MILTGRAYEDFEKYLFSFTDTLGYCACYIEGAIEQDLSEIFDRLPKSMRNALIIEWFDSVGIYIGLTRFNLGEGYFDWRIHYMGCYGHAKNRQQATKEAIIKANQIYNEKFSG